MLKNILGILVVIGAVILYCAIVSAVAVYILRG